jgi:hypothetical protein
MASSAFQLGFQTERAERAAKREHKVALEDEDRKLKFADLHDQLHALQTNAAALNKLNDPETVAKAADIYQQMNQLYHPVNAPGALQRDWEFIKGVITRKKPMPQSQATAAAPTLAATTTPTPAATSVSPPEGMEGLSEESVSLPGDTFKIGGPAGQVSTTTLPAMNVTAPPPVAAAPTPAATPAPPVAAPKPTSYERKLQAQREKAQEEAKRFLQSGPLSPEQEAAVKMQTDLSAKRTQIEGTNRIAKELLGDQWTQEDEKNLITTALGVTKVPKYMSQPFMTTDPQGRVHAYRVPLDPTMQPEEIVVGTGEQPVPKTAARGGGSDFWKTLTAKYGPNPTAAQIETERQRWAALGAHGTETITTVDAAGNSTSRRVPVFTSSQQVPEGLIPDAGTRTAAGTAGGAGPSIEAPLGSVRPSAQEGETGGGLIGGPSTPLPDLGTVPSALPPQITPPTDPAIAVPNPAEARAALAEADRLGIGNDVRAVAEYRMDPTTATSARGGQKTKFLELVQKVNPAWDATKWQSVQNTRKAFTPGGQDAVNMQALQTTVGHLNKLSNAFNALDNTWSPDYNALRNAKRVHTGYGGINSVTGAADAVSGELGRVFRGANISDHEVQTWRSNFNPNMSPDQFSNSVDTISDLMASRMAAEAQSYVSVMGSLRGFPVLAPKVVDILTAYNSEGAKQILEINRQAMLASGIRTPARGQPTTAPPPPGDTTPPPSPTTTQPKGAVSLSDARRLHPELKNKSDEEVRKIILQSGFVPLG